MEHFGGMIHEKGDGETFVDQAFWEMACFLYKAWLSLIYCSMIGAAIFHHHSTHFNRCVFKDFFKKIAPPGILGKFSDLMMEEGGEHWTQVAFLVFLMPISKVWTAVDAFA